MILEAIINENGYIYTKAALNIYSVLKGEIHSNDINVVFQDEVMESYQYLLKNQEKLERKLTKEKYEELLEEEKNSDSYVENIFAGVGNISVGDEILLFVNKYDFDDSMITLADSKELYYIVGTSYFGKFTYDKVNNEFYKANNDNDISRTDKKIIISLDELLEKTEIIEDNSKNIKIELNKDKRSTNKELLQKENSDHDFLETDPSFNKYKNKEN